MARAKKSKSTTTLPFWKRITPDGWVGIALGVVAIIVGGYFAYPSFVADSIEIKEYEKKKTEAVSPPTTGCGFPPYFVRDTLYVLITRFEDFEKENDTECWGRNIERKIDEIVKKRKMPVRFCYRNDLSPNQSYEASRCRDQFHADLIIWGKLSNAGPDCTAEGLCLEFDISDTLTINAGGEIRKSESKYETNVSSSDIQKNLFSMNGERFDQWFLGMYNLKIGKQLQSAERQAQKLFSIDENWDKEKKGETYISRGNFKASFGRYAEAIGDYDQAIALDPKNATAYNNRGAAKSDLGRHAEAIADYDQAIALDPKNAAAYNNRGIVKSDLGRYAEAIGDYDQAIALDPKNAAAYNNRGIAKWSLDRHAEAIADYDQAIALDPKYADAYLNRHIAKRKSGQYLSSFSDFCYAFWLEPSIGWSAYLLIIYILYFWKFKTINHNLRRLFTFLSQALKKALRRA